MIYIANGAGSAQWLAQDVVQAATFRWLFSLFGSYRFLVTEEEHNKTLSIWRRNDEARLAVTEALGFKLQWLIEHKVPTAPINLLGTEGDLRYRHAVCNGLADIVRDTKIIHNWRAYKIDHPQYKRDWQHFQDNWSGKPDWKQHRPPDWERYKLIKAHPATKEAYNWHEAASALQKLVNPRKKDPMVRDYPDVDLPEFELAPSWVYLADVAELV